MILHTDTVNILEKLYSLNLFVILVVLSSHISIDPLVDLEISDKFRMIGL
jgi:hypothetical protein